MQVGLSEPQFLQLPAIVRDRLFHGPLRRNHFQKGLFLFYYLMVLFQ